LNERHTTNPKPAGIKNTMASMNSTLELMPAASDPPSEATASLQLSQAKPVVRRSPTATMHATTRAVLLLRRPIQVRCTRLTIPPPAD
jgi:hypothetical protein